MNKVILVGRITKDPELKKTMSGSAFVNFSIAVNRTYTNNNGEREADFVNCVIWNKQAENLSMYVGKGSLIGVEGRIQTRNYEDKDGRRVYVTEVYVENVQFLETRRNDNAQNNNYQNKTSTNNINNNQSYNQNNQSNNSSNSFFDDFSNNNSGDILSGLDISDEELPF